MAQTAFEKYLKAERGRAKRLAADLGVAPPAISQWLASQIPAERIFQISRLTGIPVEELRPDVVKA